MDSNTFLKKGKYIKLYIAKLIIMIIAKRIILIKIKIISIIGRMDIIIIEMQ